MAVAADHSETIIRCQALVADGLHFHVPRGYLYFAIAFSAAVEALNLLAARAREKKARLHLNAAGRIVGGLSEPRSDEERPQAATGPGGRGRRGRCGPLQWLAARHPRRPGPPAPVEDEPAGCAEPRPRLPEAGAAS